MKEIQALKHVPIADESVTILAPSFFLFAGCTTGEAPEAIEIAMIRTFTRRGNWSRLVQVQGSSERDQQLHASSSHVLLRYLWLPSLRQTS